MLDSQTGTRLRRRVRWLPAGVGAIIAAVWVIAWMAPGFGLHRDDAVYLVTVRALLTGHGYTVDSMPDPIRQTEFPPLLPALLALFSLVSNNVQWLKLGPLACGVAWLWLTRKLLLKMGASRAAALAIVGFTAAAPATVFLTANFMPETLFALLLTAALLLLLEERTWAGGLCAGLALLTETAGAPLIAACVLILLMRKRLRGAARFTAAAALLAVPWVAWTAVFSAPGRIGLPASEQLAVMSHNLLLLIGSPISLLTNFYNSWTVTATAVLAIWCLYKRRQLAPDLVLLLYLLTLDLRAGPPQRLVAPVLPLILWVIWRSVRTIRPREMVVGGVLIIAGFTLLATLWQIPATIVNGEFPVSRQPPNEWRQMEKMFAWVRANTPADAVVMANLEALWYLSTGRKAIRGFTPDAFQTYYSPGATPVSAAGLAAELLKIHAGWVALSPDRDFVEAPAYRRAVEALERGGLLEAVDGVGLAPGYRLLKASGITTLR